MVEPYEQVCLPTPLKACLKTMDIFDEVLLRSTGNIFLNVLPSAIIAFYHGFSAFSRSRVKFTLV
jgi:hypothetical protein